MRKRYRIRPLSPLWWLIRISGVAGFIGGCYCWVLILAAIPTS